MRRRRFLGIASIMAAWPFMAHAQRANKIYRVGWLQPGPIPESWLTGFRQGLGEFNFVEGKNLIIEYRWGDGSFDRLPAMAAELVGLNLDAIISVNTVALQALQKATSATPIVMLGTADPVAVGLVESLARPGANITGMSVVAPELSRKRLELLKEAVPHIDRITVLTNSNNPGVALASQETLTIAESLGLSVDIVDVRNPVEIGLALPTIGEKRTGALVLLVDTMIHSQRVPIATFAINHRLPTISPFREFADAGGLMAYGPHLPDLLRRSVATIDKILTGTRPANLPVQQPTRFELVANLKTAKAIGVAMPTSILLRADQVIE
jgi:putative ABC transport system substrate-binding protein